MGHLEGDEDMGFLMWLLLQMFWESFLEIGLTFTSVLEEPAVEYSFNLTKDLRMLI